MEYDGRKNRESLDNEEAGRIPVGAHMSTRRALEGFEAKPVHYDAGDPAPVADPSVSVSPSAKPRHRSGRFEQMLQDDLEPSTKTSTRARGTAVLEGAEKSSADANTPRKRRRVPVAAKVLIALLVLLGIAGGVCWAWVSGISSSMSLDEEDQTELDEVLVDPGTNSAFYALIIGSDARESVEGARSDAIMLARVDASAGTITLVSVPRDTMVYNESGGIEKINAAYNDGPAASVRAVSEFAGVDIAHYVEVDFAGLEGVVDALGGVKVNIPEDIAAGNGGIEFSKGEQVLNGEQALAYARERYTVTGGDFGRAQAQRQIVEAIAKQILASNPVEIPGLVSQLANCVSTDLPLTDIVSYAMELRESGNVTLFSAAVPSYALESDGVSYVATMYDEWKEMMRRMDAGLNPSGTVDPVPLEQRQNERLGAATNAAGPRDYAQILSEGALTTWDVAS